MSVFYGGVSAVVFKSVGSRKRGLITAASSALVDPPPAAFAWLFSGAVGYFRLILDLFWIYFE